MNQHVQISEWTEVPARFNADEFMQIVENAPFTDWVGKVELVNGVIVRMSPAHIPHWNAQRLLFADIAAIFAKQRGDWIAGQQPTVRLSASTVREPDIAVLQIRDVVGDVFDRSALFLAIEISDSSLAIDLNEKRRNYATAGIPYYWVVDINARQVHVMTTPRDGDYLDRRVVPFGERLPVPGTDETITID